MAPNQPAAENIALRNQDEEHLLHRSDQASTLDGSTVEDSSELAKSPRHQLHIWSIATLLIGSVALFASIALLSFLWVGSGPTWRRIMINTWFTRTVTLMSALIRTVISIQAVSITSMLSALVLERNGAPIYTSLEIAMLRFSNSSPMRLLSILTTNVYQAIGAMIVFPTVIVCFTTLSSQFFSTILLSGAGAGTVLGFQRNLSLPSGFSSNYIARKGYSYTLSEHLSNYLIERTPLTFQAFVEYAEPPVLSPDVADTGLSLRAFLPLPYGQNRTALHHFEGNIEIFEARIYCVRPDIIIEDVAPAGNMLHNISGYIRPGPGNDFVANQWPFNCIVSTKHGQNGDVSASSLTICHQLPTRYDPEETVKATTIPYALPHLFFRNIRISDESKGIFQVMGYEGPWTNITINFEDRAHLVWQVSVCYEFRGADFASVPVIAINKDVSLVEPSVFLDPTSYRIDTLAVCKQLGVTDEKFRDTERGIWKFNQEKLKKPDSGAYSYSNSYYGEDYFQSVTICTNCTSSFFSLSTKGLVLEEVQSAIFMDTLLSTNNPALALQALVTNLKRMLYTENLKFFDSNDTQIATFYETAIIPLKPLGFIIVITLILLHLIATFWIAAAFLIQTRYSRLNNAWQVLSHFRTLRTDDFLDESLTDKEIKARLQAQGTAYELVRLEPHGDNGEIGLWRRSEKKVARNAEEEELMESEQREAA